MSDDVPTLDDLRAFLHKQIAEARRMNEPDRADRLLEEMNGIEETHAFIEQTVGERAASAWIPTAYRSLT